MTDAADRSGVEERPWFWQLASERGGFWEGQTHEELLTALAQVMKVEDAKTPRGLIPSGNLSLYWYRKR